jgi:hypothetical protein
MLNLAFVLTALSLSAFFPTCAFALDKQELTEAKENLDKQLVKLQGQESKACPNDYKSLAQQKPLKIALYYGYENYEEVTSDELHATAFAQTLEKNCASDKIEACGFKKVAGGANFFRLQKIVNGQPVELKIYFTSVTDVDKENKMFGKKGWEQSKRSDEIRLQFYKDLRESDVVYYSGHSRVGTGFGFSTHNPAKMAFKYVFRTSLTASLEALRFRPSRLKVLGIFGCTTDKFYRAPVQEANPNVDMIVSNVDLAPAPGEQSMLGSLNAMLTRQCQAGVKQSLTAAADSKVGNIEYKRAPNSARNKQQPGTSLSAPADSGPVVPAE